MAATEVALTPALQAWAQLCVPPADYERISQDLGEKQAQSATSVKKLAGETRAFEQLAESERLEAAPTLLKAYQQEVQALSKRAKSAEGAMLDLSKRLMDSPSPAVVQEELQRQCGAKARMHESMVKDLQETLRQREAQVAKLATATADIEAELQTMKNQDVTVRRLQKQIKEMESGSEASVGEARRQKDEEWARRLEELQLEVKDAQMQLQRERELNQGELERLRRERMEEQQRVEETRLAHHMEVDSLSGDLERLQAELERERLQRLEKKDVQETPGSVKMLQSLLDSSQKRSLGLERELAMAQRQVTEAEARARCREAEFEAERSRNEDVLAARDAEAQSLREQLGLRPSFEEVAELRQRLRNVETVELSDEAGASTDLELRLLQRQRTLEGQLSEARVRTSELVSEAELAQKQLRAAGEETQDLKSLVARLEDQLASGGKGVQAPAASPASLEALMPEGDPEQAKQGMPSLLDIVAGQRDRLRERLGDLEQERDRWRASAQEARNSADAMQKDNVKLLERARFLQSLQPGPAGSRTRKTVGAADKDLESRYGGAYEESLGPSNPWEQFREDEKARRVASLGSGERLLVAVGSALLSSKVVRLFVMGYALAMHFLVFAVLLRLAQMHHSC